jgi:hypothetical protein
MSERQLDRAGRRRSPATAAPGSHAGRAPRNKGLRYPADPPKVEEIVAVMRAAGDGAHGRRLRSLIVILWRAGLRIQEALALRAISIRDEARCSFAAGRADAGARSEWTTGAGRNSSPGSSVASNSLSDAVLRHQRDHMRPRLGDRSSPRPTPTHSGSSRSAPPLRTAPAPPRPRRRDGARRRPADRHPTPTRPQQPRHHIRLPARNRQRRDHRSRPRPTRTDDPRQRIPSTLKGTQEDPRSSRHETAR